MAPPKQRRYRIPACLRDLVMVDLLELTGSTTAAAAMLQISQPSVSRRYRALAGELGLGRGSGKPLGRRYGDTAWLDLLRRGVNRHRHGCGVLRVGGPPHLGGAMGQLDWIEWVGLSGKAQAQWQQLLQLDLLDAVVMEHADGRLDPPRQDRLVVVQIGRSGSTPLLLVCRADPLVLEIAGRNGRAREIS